MTDTTYELTNSRGDLLSVHSVGAKVVVSLNNIPIIGSFARGDGKTGLTHPCTPIFGPDRKKLYGLSQHGNMRNEECLIEKKNDSIHVSHLITDSGYPAGMKVEQSLSIKDGIFSFEMTHTNAGDKEAFVNAGEHCYFDAPLGYVGTMVNGQDITKLIEDNFDGIAIDILEKNVIQIPGKPVYELAQQGLKKAVVWVGKNPETKEIDKSYVCIEPVEGDPFGDFFGSQESMIRPGESRIIQFSLSMMK
jgi:hypothetical protein